MSYGILQALGITETVAQSEAEYVELAVRLATDVDWRNSLSQQYLVHSDRLFDDGSCLVALETFYRTQSKSSSA